MRCVCAPIPSLGNRFRVGPGDDKPAAEDIEIFTTPPASPHPFGDARQRDFLDIAARAEGMQACPVADFAGNAQHCLADGGDRDRHHRQPVGSGEKSGVISVSL